MDKKILSKDFLDDIERMIRRSIEEITEEDCNKIERVTLNAKQYNGTEKDYVIKDLLLFPNLKVISFSKFCFNNEVAQLLNQLKKLEFISFDFCKFDLDYFLFEPHVKNLTFNVCKNLNINMLKNTKVTNLKIISSEIERAEIDIKDFVLLENIEQLSLHNFYIKNIKDILKIAPKLYSLNLDGSEIEDEVNLKELPLRISHEEKFLRANANYK